MKSPVPDKLDTLRDLLLSLPDTGQAIVFVGYRESAERVAHYLEAEHIECGLYHGGLEQGQRERALLRFRHASVRVLVSTDIAARGLDIDGVGHVIHYHLPADREAYTHRNGRTARAGASGTAYFILGPDEQVPEYVDSKPTYFNLRPRTAFAPSEWSTVYIGRGRREKISRGDVLGFFGRVGGVDGKDIGRIDVTDHASFVALRRTVVHGALERVKGQKIKGDKTHYILLS